MKPDVEKLNTYAKGDRFEEQVFDFLSKEIIEGRFYAFRPECCKIFRKKGYYSRDREDFIIFDVSVEIFLPGFDTPSMLVLIECKNYNGKVPVGDIEEFGSKISQVSGFNAKGIFASASAFQSGTFNIARNRGFGVLRFFEPSEFRWQLPRALLTGARSARARKRAEIEYALTEPHFKPTVYNAYALTPAGFTDGWDGIWKGLGLESVFREADLARIRLPSLVTAPRVAFISRERIESLATQVLRSITYVHGAVDLNAIVNKEATASGLVVSYLESSTSALGSITFAPLEIKIFAEDSQAQLARFTLAHELGHHFLNHKCYMTRESIRAQEIDQAQFITIPKGEVERLEWQANTFASCLLMPSEDFQTAFGLLLRHLGIRNRGHGPLYLDSQPDNVSQFETVCASLSKYFNVSKTAIRLRMRALGLLVEVER
ncbi:ImmA/IrrE family metallo-endopeptidase [Pseudomonas syringae]|uniref:ImmA/IrrE family metallo-endopeptidase n=1 Tax=Pseudomonas sp. MWU16-30316 TaxID=2878093 RepID=UPI001102CF4D|nr:ImmA/IrrE family metallo-endopeptidase [Pseudomonas sp. MWU16-30316]TFZ36065.1 ImmA/IrrE family metallo-endopeptidase [Pseudomonas syringae]